MASNPESGRLVSALTIFLGAFLLFFIQPLVARQLLPSFGGAASVWLSCLLFFQLFLLLGYCYAHVLRVLFAPVLQGAIHICLIIFCIALTLFNGPILTSDVGTTNPQTEIALKLSAGIGLPFILLAATSPLVQNWYSLSSQNPYRLYALSNAGSLLALLSYPFLIEPGFTITEQFNFWIIGISIYLMLSAIILKSLLPHTGRQINQPLFRENSISRIYWVSLSACGALLLLSTTNELIREAAPIPLLWVLPLSVYLITFIICFDKPRWYRRPPYFSLFGISLIVLTILYESDTELVLVIQIFVYCLVLFSGCMICHGEMVRRRPNSDQLTEFYLFLSAGGVIGAFIVNMLAPFLFSGYYEFEVAIILTVLLGSHSAIASRTSFVKPLRILAVSAASFLFLFFAGFDKSGTAEELSSSRSFYGVLNVVELQADTPAAHNKLFNDNISHGSQLTGEEYRHIPNTYYSYQSGVGKTLLNFRKKHRRVGIVGLGAGTIAAYGNEDDQFRFYEINPAVLEIANSYFTYLRDSKADITIVEGDARLSLAQDLANGYVFDILIIDAFSGDAIPTHLLTAEAWQLYWKLLNENGVLAIHLSNKYIDLIPVVQFHNDRQGNTRLVQIDNEDDPSWDINAASWLLQTSNRPFLAGIKEAVLPPITDKQPMLWTDEKAAILGLLY